MEPEGSLLNSKVPSTCPPSQLILIILRYIILYFWIILFYILYIFLYYTDWEHITGILTKLFSPFSRDPSFTLKMDAAGPRESWVPSSQAALHHRCHLFCLVSQLTVPIIHYFRPHQTHALRVSWWSLPNRKWRNCSHLGLSCIHTLYRLICTLLRCRHWHPFMWWTGLRGESKQHTSSVSATHHVLKIASCHKKFWTS
jgi:hypothetical protein